MAFRGRSYQNPPPVRRIELSGGNKRGRIFLIVVLLVVAVGALAYGIINSLRVDPGWTEISPVGTTGFEGQLVMQYYLGTEDPAAQKKELNTLYTETAADAWKIFSADTAYEGVGNLYTVNSTPNQTVTVDAALYRALEQVQNSGSRSLYLAPIWMQYNNIFHSAADEEAAQYDPYEDEAVAEYVGQLAAFIRDPEHIDLELLGDNQVRLHVSEQYAKFAEENGIERYLDLYRMKNAFAMDYIGDVFRAHGSDDLFLASADGYSLCLYDGDEQFSVAVYTQDGEKTVPAASTVFRGPCTVVSLHSFSTGAGDEYVYRYKDGRVRTSYIDLDTGLCMAAAPHLAAYSSMTGCVGVLLDTEALYTAPEMDHDAVRARYLRSSAIVELAWCEGSTVYYTAADADMTVQKGFTAKSILSE